MSVVLSKSLFFHIPKTGGTWVKGIFEQNDMIIKPLANYHMAPSKKMRTEYVDYTFFAFVRHPLSFYQSFWGFQTKKNWNRLWGRAFIEKTKANKFENFIDNVIKFYPQGFVTTVYNKYLPYCDMIGRYETLRKDLADILTKAGEFVPIEHINDNPPLNTSKHVTKNVHYRPDQIRSILKMENTIVRKYYLDDFKAFGYPKEL